MTLNFTPAILQMEEFRKRIFLFMLLPEFSLRKQNWKKAS